MNNRLHPVRAIALITAFCLMGDSMLYVLLPFYWREAGLHSLLEAGILLSVNRFVRLPIGPLVGILLQRISIRRGLLLAIVLAVCTTVAYGFAQGFLFWFVLRCMWGFTWSLLRLGAFYAIADTSRADEHGKNTGTYNGLFRLGSLAGMLFGGVLAQAWGLSAASLLFGALALLSLLLLPTHVLPSAAAAALSSDRSSAHQQRPGTGRHSVARAFWSPTLLLIAGSGTVIALIYQGIFTSTLSHVVDLNFHTGLALGWFSIGAISLAGFLQAMRWGWEPFLAPLVGNMTDRLPQNNQLLTLALLCASPLFALVPVALPAFSWLALIIAIQLSATALTTLIDAAASRAGATMPAGKGKAFLTLYSVLQDTGAALGPLLGYLLLPGRLYLTCAFLLLALCLCWYGGNRQWSGNILKAPER